ncbi:pyridoxal-phosphate dependent enzyme [Shewanella sp. Isolate11]|uniref:pyridoxal-phosphate dependent enzyme n=1 Tax=Shewanella sp. Isolate11 TaxID=2908530 RepID=UPI001EFC36AB|nr:pyridoxal-phosphate dependent enzyme [Shewanella sp. Isolate11]MCG9696802.1 1-aminocyclopropane-1-carboxylate deaminase/D-cysteine desulfhydrase [Shewanella sp. Isolate11]
MKLAQTPVDKICFEQHQIFVKRDDLLHPEFSGNKARKFAYFLANDFPGITKLVGYGSPQANSLYSMSALAKLKGWQLDFYVDHIAGYLRANPLGNYQAALVNGANIIDLSLRADRSKRDTLSYIEQSVMPVGPKALFVPEGGRCHYAEYGVRQLACEIIDWKQQQELSELVVFLPSGTGTTALYLSKSFKQLDASIRVCCCAVVGGEDYLKQQFTQLETDVSLHPQILDTHKRYHFGKLYPEFYQIWQQLKDTGIEFELLYDPLGWMVLSQHLAEFGSQQVLYLHQGGLLGNQSMLPRYQRKYGVSN